MIIKRKKNNKISVMETCCSFCVNCVRRFADKTTQHYFFRGAKLRHFYRFLAANYESLLSFFPVRQVSEKIFNESLKSTENAQIE
jgi:hypothetical protein